MIANVDCRDVRGALTALRPVNRLFGPTAGLVEVDGRDGRIVLRCGVIEVGEVEIAGEVTGAGMVRVGVADLTGAVKGRRDAVLEIADGRLEVRAGGVTVTVPAAGEDLPAFDLPGLADEVLEVVELEVDEVRAVCRAIATDPARPILESLLVAPDGLAATDSYRLVVVDRAVGISRPVLIPRWAIVTVLRDGAPIRLEVDGRDFRVSAGAIRCGGRQVGGSFPQYRSLIVRPDGILEVDGGQLREVLAGMPKTATYATVEAADGGLIVTGHAETGGAGAVAGIVGDLSGTGSVTWNRAYVLDLLADLAGPVAIAVDSIKPTLLEVGPETRLVMPVRAERLPYAGPPVVFAAPGRPVVRPPATRKRAAVKRTSGKNVARTSGPTVPPAAAVPVPASGAADLPSVVVEWLERLVYAPKREYAVAWAAHVFAGADAPADPERPWADKVRDRVERYRLAVA